MKKSFTLILIVLLSVTIRGIIGVFHADPLTDVVSPSILVSKIGFPPVAAGLILIAYLILSFVFFITQKSLPGNKIQKGIVFGIVFGCLWLYRMIEGTLEMKASLVKELLFGLTDFIPIFILSILLGRIIGDDSETKIKDLIKTENKISILFIVIFYSIGRIITYKCFNIGIAFDDNPVFTIFWVVGHGFLTGIMYLILKTDHKNIIQNAVCFSFVIFGLDWLIFNFFGIVLFDISYSTMFRPLIDIISIFCGIAMFSFYRNYRIGVNK